MRKKLTLVLLALICTIPAMAQQSRKQSSPLRVRTMATTSGPTTTVLFTWSPYTGYPLCPANGVQVNCVSGFTLSDTSSNQVLAGPTALPASSTSFTYTPVGGLFYGTHTFSLVANGFDNNGGSLTSPPAVATVVNSLTSLAAPGGFTATQQ